MTKEELQQWLQERRWTQSRLASELGMNPRQIYRWMKGVVAIPKWFVTIKDKL
jgi:transcriptional regulator with XRE-family HTH domain